ncbi:MAG: JAB domain-containing protein [Vicinamibacterales bacterium]
MQTDVIRVRELTVKYTVKKVTLIEPLLAGPVLRTALAAAALLTQKLQDEPSEIFAILCLDLKFRLIAYHEVSRGTLHSTCAHPREVFRAALLANAAALILAHNHPSGDPSPSAPDFQMTHRLCEAGELLGIPIHDHLIIGDGNYFSFRDAERLRT